jgi:hypothetical protein
MFYNIGPQKSSREKKVEEQLLLQAQKKAHLWYTNFLATKFSPTYFFQT